MGALTESIVDFVAGTAPDDPPAPALATAKLGFTDCLGVMIAGAGEPVTRNLAAYVESRRRAESPGESRMLLGRRRSAASLAALVGTGAAHALDFDDYAFSNHVSALLVPAILAEAERSGAGGAAMLRAYVTGYEVWGAVMKREPDHLHSKGWHPTGVFGPIGVAAALSQLRGFDRERTRNALGLAAANGSGLMDNFGTQAKPYQGARAAEAGVVCVELALAGLDAGRDAIDGDGGLLAALSPAGRADLKSPADSLGSRWTSAESGLNVKPHPTVGASQRAIDAAIQLRGDHAPEIAEIDRIVARVSEKHAAVMRMHRPSNAMEAKFSLEFGVAAALIAGKVGLAEVSDDFVARDDVQALLRKVRIETGLDDDPDYPVGAKTDSVALRLRDGREIESEPVRRFRGHGANPMSADELKRKFDDCVAPALGQSAADALFDTLQDLENLKSVADLPVLEL